MALYLREAVKADIDLLYRWANDSEVRKNAFHTEQIPYDTHKVWFENVLKDRNVLQYIFIEKHQGMTKEIGQIRLSLDKDRAVIGYSIAEDMRGKGFGTRMVQMAEEKLREVRKEIAVFAAQVKYENKASAKVFEKCGYTSSRKMEYIEYTKAIR